MKFGSVCSGIGAPEVAWSALGWEPQWFAALGNSMAVPVLRWLGQRIELVHRIQEVA